MNLFNRLVVTGRMKYRWLVLPMVMAFSAVAQKTWTWQTISTEAFTLTPKQLKDLGQPKKPEGRESTTVVQIEVSATYPVNVAYVQPSMVAGLQGDFKSISRAVAPCKYVNVMNLRANCSVPREAFPVTLIVQDSNQAWLSLHEGGQSASNNVKVKLSDYEFR